MTLTESYKRFAEADPAQLKRIRIRFAIIATFILATFAFGPILGPIRNIPPVLILCSLALACNLISLIWIISGKGVRYNIYFATFVDVLLITIAVHYMGGIETTFSWVYVLVLVAVALLHGVRIALYVAIVSSVLYSGLLIGEFAGIIPHVGFNRINPEYLHNDTAYLYTQLFSNNVLFFITAGVSGYLSQKLLQSKNELETAVVERTRELSTANERLQLEMADRKKADQAWLEEGIKYRMLVEQSLQGVMIVKDFKVIFCNAAACEICGYSVEELHSISPDQMKAMVHPDDQMMVWNRYRARLEGKLVPQDYQYRIIRKDGTVRWLEMHSRRVEYDGGPATQLALLDINDRKQADEALRESEEKYRTLFEESTDGVFISSPDSKFVDINPAGVEIYGFSSKEELLEVDIAQDLYMDPGKREEIKSLLAEKGFVKDYELHYKRKDGTEAIVLETVNAVYNDAGDIVAYRGIMRDVTEQKQLERQLFQAQKMESIGTLAGGIAHDFNNLLGGILGFASLIKAKTPEDHAIFDYANTIEASATRAAELTSQLLGFARGGKFEAAPVNLNKIVDETLEIVGRTFDKSMEIETNLFSKLPTVEANAGQLQQVLLNLCVNAHDAMDGMGKLIITTNTELLTDTYVEANIQAKPGLYVVLAVSDTGVGIDKEIIPRVFEPFFSTKKDGKGTGLGLSMVYGVIKNHGGFVNVYSELCVGSTFKVYLPASGKPELMETLETGPATGGDELILVVDDEDSIRYLAEEMLESGGYKVLLAENGVEAANIYENSGKEIGLVILDMVMPKMGGRETFLKLKAMDPEVKTLLSTGYSQDGKTQAILDSGVKGFLQKPYQLNALLSKVRGVLDMKN